MSSDKNQEFIATMRDWLCSLPHDLKVLFEAKDDPNLERSAKELATAAIMFLLNSDSPSSTEFSDFADDAIILRQVLRKVADTGGEDAEAFCQRFEEYFTTLDEDLALCKEVMGDEIYGWISRQLSSIDKLVHKGKKIARYLDHDEDSELLYDEGLEFQTEYSVDEELLERRFKKVETLLDPLSRKADQRRMVSK